MTVVAFRRREWKCIEYAIQQCQYFVEWRDTIADSLWIDKEQVRVEPSDPFILGEDKGCLFLVIRPLQSRWNWRMAGLSYVTIITLKKERYTRGYGSRKFTIYLVDQLAHDYPIEKIQAETGWNHYPMTWQEFQAKYK